MNDLVRGEMVDHDHIYDILDENPELVREVSIHDFRTAFERW